MSTGIQHGHSQWSRSELPCALEGAGYDFVRFFEKSEMPGLVDIIDGLWTAFPWDVTNLNNERGEESLAEHARILAAMRSGDLEEVAAAAGEHVKNSYLALVEHLTGKPAIDPFPVDGDVME